MYIAYTVLMISLQCTGGSLMNMSTSLMNLSSTDVGSGSMQQQAAGLAPPLHSATSMMRVFDDDGTTQVQTAVTS
jgi:hypothetical protein